MEQSAAQTPFCHKVIRASAGAGKTHQLTNRYIQLLLANVAPDQILATTFTRKAAGEIRDRVLHRLALAATEDAERAALARDLGGGPLTRDDCLHLLLAITRRLHRLRISTLDSFFSAIASSFSLELNLPPGWRIADDLVDSRIRTEAIQALLRGQPTRDLTTLLHLLAKGQTERSVSQLMRSTVNELYDVFQETPPAAWQCVPRPRALTADELKQAVENLAQAPLPRDKRWEGAREVNCRLAAAGDWEEFVAKGIAAKVLAGAPSYYSKPIEPAVAAPCQTLLSHARAVLLNQLADQTEATRQLLEEFDAHYQRLKHARQAFRFDDVTQCLSRTADAARLAYRLDGQIAHLLLDEFQDTSLSQWRVIEPLARQIVNGGARHSFFCVGDIKQAIYGWRGGVAEIFDAVDQQLPGLVCESLDVSYRSAQPVIDVVNRVFGNLSENGRLEPASPAVEAWDRNFQEHKTAKKELEGYVCLATARRGENDEGQLEATLAHAAQRVVEIVQEAAGCSVGVLVRRNTAVGRLIYHLRRLDVNASEEGGNPLTDSAAVQILLSLLKLADHPGDTVARFHVAHSPLSPAAGLPDDQDGEQAHRLAADVRRALLADGYGPTLHRYACFLATSCNRRELSRLEQLIALAYNYQDSATLRTADFLELAAKEKVADPLSANVRVMTIHQAKGLQFDVVVLPDLEADLLGQRGSLAVGRPAPTAPADCVCRWRKADVRRLLPERLQQIFTTAEDQDLAESLRVLYVAVTRAIHALHMIIAPSSVSERTTPRSFAGLLRAALADAAQLPAASLVFEHGNRKWFQQLSSPARVDGGADERLEPLVPRLAPMTGGRRRGLDRASPSALEGGRRISLSDVFRDEQSALSRGTLFHAWFEQIGWLEDGPPDDAALRQVALEAGAAAETVDQQLAEFRAMLQQPDIASVLCRRVYDRPANLPLDKAVLAELASAPLEAEAYAERPFAVREGDTILRGAIDRLVVLRSGPNVVAADVLDYKTDVLRREDPAALELRTEYYRPQLEAYRRAAARLTGLAVQRVAARLLFVGPGVVKNIWPR